MVFPHLPWTFFKGFFTSLLLKCLLSLNENFLFLSLYSLILKAQTLENSAHFNPFQAKEISKTWTFGNWCISHVTVWVFKLLEFTAVEWGNDIFEHPVHELVELNKDKKLEHVLINMFTGMLHKEVANIVYIDSVKLLNRCNRVSFWYL